MDKWSELVLLFIKRNGLFGVPTIPFGCLEPEAIFRGKERGGREMVEFSFISLFLFSLIIIPGASKNQVDNTVEYQSF